MVHKHKFKIRHNEHQQCFIFHQYVSNTRDDILLHSKIFKNTKQNTLYNKILLFILLIASPLFYYPVISVIELVKCIQNILFGNLMNQSIYVIDISYDEEDHVVTRGFIDMPGG
jgi:hypothetical protein